MLEKIFKLSHNRTTVKTETLAGFTTFLTMAYIVVVIPILLSQAGMDRSSVFVATALIAIFGTLMMGLIANYPIAVAPSMSLATYFVFTIVIAKGYPWQEALGAVFMSGILFLIINAINLRQKIVNAIPMSMKVALTVGIGLFLGFIALKDAHVITQNPNTYVQMGSVLNHTVVLSFIGFIVIAVLDYLRIPGAILLGILITTLLSIIFGYNHYHGFASLPPSIADTFLSLKLSYAHTVDFWAITFTMFYVSFFDCTGTLIGVTQNTHLVDGNGNMRNMRRALFSDSFATVLSGVFGASPAGAFLESAAGIKAGGRTGLTACIVACLFILCLFFSPLIATIPTYATTPALFYVACLMIQNTSRLDWKDLTETIPCVLTIILIPLTFSISDGIAAGLIAYVLLKFFTYKWKEINLILLVITALSLVYLLTQS